MYILPDGERARWSCQDRRRRPGSRPLASPFALRRELPPTSPNLLDDTSATPLTAARPPQHPFRPVLTPAATLLQVTARKHIPHTSFGASHVLSTTTPETTSPLAAPHVPAPPPRLDEAMDAFTDAAADAQDTQEEECQEGHPVLPDGVRRLRYRYATSTWPGHQCKY